MILAHVGCLFSTHRTSVGVRQKTHDVCGCPSAHIGRLWLSVCVCGCSPTHTGHLWQSMAAVSRHTTSVCVRQHTQDVRGCPSAHTGPLCVSVCVRQRTQDVRGCPSVHISARWSLYSARWPLSWTVWVSLAHVGCVFSTHRTSVGVQKHTQDVRGCPSAHT